MAWVWAACAGAGLVAPGCEGADTSSDATPQAADESSSGAEAEAGVPAAEGAEAADAGAESTPEPVRGPDDPNALSGFVVVKSGSLLYLGADSMRGVESPTWARTLTKDDPAISPPTEGLVFMVAGEAGDRVAVETLPQAEPDDHCAPGVEGLEDFRLRFFVDRADLLPVVNARVEEKFDDDTSIAVEVGAPLRVTGIADEVVADARGVLVMLGVSEAKRGLSYELPPRKPRRFESENLPETREIRYASGRKVAGRHHLDGGKAPMVFAHGDSGSGMRVEVANDCVAIRGEVDSFTTGTGYGSTGVRSGLYAMKGPADPLAGLGGTIGTIGTPYGTTTTTVTATEHRVGAGATTYWEDGDAAGLVVAPHQFSSAAREIGARLCFVAELGGEARIPLSVCFDPGEVEPVTVTRTEVVPVAEAEEEIGLGAVGLIGGATTSRSKRVPRVRMAKAKVKGALDKDIIRRIIRAHINEVRYCYNQGLVRDPGLKGRVAVQFTIGPTGKVPVSVVASTTVKDKKVSNCIAKAVKRWKFPRPTSGGNVVVTYPFVLAPG